MYASLRRTRLSDACGRRRGDGCDGTLRASEGWCPRHTDAAHPRAVCSRASHLHASTLTVSCAAAVLPIGVRAWRCPRDTSSRPCARALHASRIAVPLSRAAAATLCCLLTGSCAGARRVADAARPRDTPPLPLLPTPNPHTVSSQQLPMWATARRRPAAQAAAVGVAAE